MFSFWFHNKSNQHIVFISFFGPLILQRSFPVGQRLTHKSWLCDKKLEFDARVAVVGDSAICCAGCRVLMAKSRGATNNDLALFMFMCLSVYLYLINLMYLIVLFFILYFSCLSNPSNLSNTFNLSNRSNLSQSFIISFSNPHCLYIYPSIHLTIYLSTCLPIYLTVHLSFYFCTSLSGCLSLSIHMSVYLFTSLFMHLSLYVYLFTTLSICRYVYTSTQSNLTHLFPNV